MSKYVLWRREIGALGSRAGMACAVVVAVPEDAVGVPMEVGREAALAVIPAAGVGVVALMGVEVTGRAAVVLAVAPGIFAADLFTIGCSSCWCSGVFGAERGVFLEPARAAPALCPAAEVSVAAFTAAGKALAAAAAREELGGEEGEAAATRAAGVAGRAWSGGLFLGEFSTGAEGGGR